MMSDPNTLADTAITPSSAGSGIATFEPSIPISKPTTTSELTAAVSAPTPPDSPLTTSASASFTAADITSALTSDLLIQQPTQTAECFRALCPLCSARKPIYCCPRCFQRTCSVTCYKKHKLRELCNGIRDPAAFVKRSALMNEGALNRDYAFLTGLERGVLTAPIEQGGQEGHERRKLEKMLKDRGIEIRFAPWRGFGRAKENKTRAVARKNNRAAHLAFTINFQLMSYPSDNASVTNSPVSNELAHNVSEHTSIIESYFNTRNPPKKSAPSTNPTDSAESTEPMQPTEAIIPTDSTSPKKPTKTEKHLTEFYLVLQAPGGKKCCTKLDKLKDWKWNLRGRTVVEYPDVLVVTSKEGDRDGERMLKGWEVKRDERPIVEVKEEEVKKLAEKKVEGMGIQGVSMEEPVPTVEPKEVGPEVGTLAETGAGSTALEAAVALTEASTEVPSEAPKMSTHGGLLEPDSSKRKHEEDEDDLTTTIGAIKKARSSALAF
ncbi:hypothetical protein FPQ18DRAFT_295972 [Pyronema domesticum]|nr:hypothetical protein FPQ18DRAFT_295972 [Pyronema domesticum]